MWASLEVDMFRLFTIMIGLGLIFSFSLSAHVGNTAHLHCEDCGNEQHTGECPSDGFWIGLGKTILSEFIPGMSTTDYILNSNPHDPLQVVGDINAGITSLFVTPISWLSDVTEKPFNKFAGWVLGQEWCDTCESLDGYFPGRVDCPDCDNNRSNW